MFFSLMAGLYPPPLLMAWPLGGFFFAASLGIYIIIDKNRSVNLKELILFCTTHTGIM